MQNCRAIGFLPGMRNAYLADRPEYMRHRRSTTPEGAFSSKIGGRSDTISGEHSGSTQLSFLGRRRAGSSQSVQGRPQPVNPDRSVRQAREDDFIRIGGRAMMKAECEILAVEYPADDHPDT